MKGMPYQRARGDGESGPVSNDYVSEALAKQAASRPAKTPPKIMPVTPTLPKVPKPRRNKRR